MTEFYEIIVRKVGGKEQLLTSPFADGNCAFYGYANILVAGITANKIKLDELRFNSLKIYFQKIPDYVGSKEERRKLFDKLISVEKENRFEGDTSQIMLQVMRFQALVNQQRLTFDKFSDYLRANMTREALIAYNIVLAPALRAMADTESQKIYINELGMTPEEARAMDPGMNMSGVYAGSPQILALNKVLNLNVRIISEDSPADFLESNAKTSSFTLFLSAEKSTTLTSQHWHNIISLDEAAGLISFLKNRSTEQSHIPASKVNNSHNAGQTQSIMQTAARNFSPPLLDGPVPVKSNMLQPQTRGTEVKPHNSAATATSFRPRPRPVVVSHSMIQIGMFAHKAAVPVPAPPPQLEKPGIKKAW